MKILFWGTPQYAVTTLEALHDAGHSLVGVVTQPDRRRGRGQQLVASPVWYRRYVHCPFGICSAGQQATKDRMAETKMKVRLLAG